MTPWANFMAACNKYLYISTTLTLGNKLRLGSSNRGQEKSRIPMTLVEYHGSWAKHNTHSRPFTNQHASLYFVLVSELRIRTHKHDNYSKWQVSLARETNGRFESVAYSYFTKAPKPSARARPWGCAAALTETCPNGNATSRPLGAGGDGSSYPGERPFPVRPAGLSTVPPDYHSGASPLEVKQGGVVGLSGGVVCACVWVCMCVGVWVLLCKPAGTIIAYFTFSILMPRPVFIKKQTRY